MQNVAGGLLHYNATNYVCMYVIEECFVRCSWTLPHPWALPQKTDYVLPTCDVISVETISSARVLRHAVAVYVHEYLDA